jgi:uncharacterized protein
LNAIRPHNDGAVLSVLASPGAKRSMILGERAGAVRVAVTSAPENGRANEAIRTVLAEALDCRRSQITLISGATSRRKQFLISEMTAANLNDRLAALVPKGDTASEERSNRPAP